METKRKITGLMIEYYLICHRKLWLFSRNINLESGNDDVAIGKSIDEHTFYGVEKHVMILNTINIDFIAAKKEIHEVKKSKKLKDVSIWQLKYYLYFLKKLGVEGCSGILHFPESKQIEDVSLSEQDIFGIEHLIDGIEEIVELEGMPDKIDSKICQKCAYFEFCYI